MCVSLGENGSGVRCVCEWYLVGLVVCVSIRVVLAGENSVDKYVIVYVSSVECRHGYGCGCVLL